MKSEGVAGGFSRWVGYMVCVSPMKNYKVIIRGRGGDGPRRACPSPLEFEKQKKSLTEQLIYLGTISLILELDNFGPTPECPGHVTLTTATPM